MEIYALIRDNNIFNADFFSSKDKAIKIFNKKKKDIKRKIGVISIKDSEDEFSYIFGWEENKVTWKIIEIILDLEYKEEIIKDILD
jgi:hypothetical protein